tara:strand:+ start:771 stop:875 length:105 start_codon:yes stop_codon:yes gene_type:complete
VNILARLLGLDKPNEKKEVKPVHIEEARVEDEPE